MIIARITNYALHFLLFISINLYLFEYTLTNIKALKNTHSSNE